MRRWIILGMTCVMLSGCASWKELSQGEYRDKKRKFTTVVSENWMRNNVVPDFFMTKDGSLLNRVVVLRQKLEKKLNFTKKKFLPDMTPQDLAEVELDEVQSINEIGAFELISNEPATIDGRTGFRVEYTYRAKGGLLVQGIRYGFLYEERIYRIQYEAAQQHYFERDRDDFEQFVKEFKVL